MATLKAYFNSGSEDRSVSYTLVPNCPRHFGTGAEVCPLDTSAPTQKSETLWHQTHSAEMSWVRSVLGLKCLYTSQHISLRTSARNTRWSSVPLLCVPFRRTSFTRRSFSTATPLTWNSLPPAVLNCGSLSSFKSRLKTHLFSTAFC